MSSSNTLPNVQPPAAPPVDELGQGSEPQIRPAKPATVQVQPVTPEQANALIPEAPTGTAPKQAQPPSKHVNAAEQYVKNLETQRQGEQEYSDFLYRNNPEEYKKANPKDYYLRKISDAVSDTIKAAAERGIEHDPEQLKQAIKPHVDALADLASQGYTQGMLPGGEGVGKTEGIAAAPIFPEHINFKEAGGVERRAPESLGRSGGAFGKAVDAAYQAGREPSPTANEDIAKIANNYNAKNGQGPIDHTPAELPSKEDRAKLADEYENAKHEPNNPEVKKSYDAMKQETLTQFNHLRDNGIKFDFTPIDPYKSADEMMKDVRDNHHLSVYTESGVPADHPLAEVEPTTGQTYNTIFRGVHDVLGHVPGGHDFSENGEESAFKSHSQMYSPEARPAVAAETQGQSNWFFNHKGVREGAEPGQFAPQQAALLPSQVTKYGPQAESKIHPALETVGKNYRVEPVHDSIKYEPSLIRPDGQVIYLGSDQHPTAISKVPGYGGTESERTRFLNDTGAIRVRPNMQQRDGETFHFTIPEKGVTHEQVQALKQTAASLGGRGNLMFETASKPSELRSNMSRPDEWQWKGASDVEPILSSMKALPEQKVSFKEVGGKYVGGHTKPDFKSLVEQGGGVFNGAKGGLVEITLPRDLTNRYDINDRFKNFVSVTLPENELTAENVKAAIQRKDAEMMKAHGVPAAAEPEERLDLGDVDEAKQPTWADTAEQMIMQHTAGGLDPHTGKEDETGYGFEVNPEARQTFDHRPTAEDFQAYYDQNKEFLDKNPEIRIGWDQQPSGKWELNMGMRVENPEAAKIVAKKLDQRAAWDIANKKEIPAGGKGEQTKFPNYPLDQRVAEAKKDIIPGSEVVKHMQQTAGRKITEKDAQDQLGLDAYGNFIKRDVPVDQLMPGDSYHVGLAAKYARQKGEFPAIVIDADGKIADGNHRVAAAQIRGDKTIPAYISINEAGEEPSESFLNRRPQMQEGETGRLNAKTPAQNPPVGFINPDGKFEAFNSTKDKNFGYESTHEYFAANRGMNVSDMLKDGWVRKAGQGAYDIGKLTETTKSAIEKDLIQDAADLRGKGKYGPIDYIVIETPTKGYEIPRKDFFEEYNGDLGKAMRNARTFAVTPDEPTSPLSTVPLIKNPLKVKGSGDEGAITTFDIAKALNKFSKNAAGRAELNKAEPEEMVKRATDAMEDEAKYQLAQNNTGEHWYTKEIGEHDAVLRELRPELQDSNKLSLFKASEAILSSGQKPYSNLKAAIKAWDAYNETGVFPEKNPETGKSWGPRGIKAYGSAFDSLNKLIAEKGEAGAATWLTSQHPISELKKYMSPTQSPPRGKASDLAFGAQILGAKRGPFALNLHGIETEFTADMWVSRTWNRLMGTMEFDNETGEIKSDAPRNAAERSLMKQSFDATAKRLGKTTSAMQAVMWYYEQALYRAHGIPVESWSFSDAARRIQQESKTGETVRPEDREEKHGQTRLAFTEPTAERKPVELSAGWQALISGGRKTNIR